MIERALRIVPRVTPEDSYIQVVGVSKTYAMGGQHINALRDVNLYIRRGEFVAICGSSGSGKTTLLNLLGCLAAPSSGKIILDQTDVSALGDKDLALFRARNLGFIFQNFNLLPVLSAAENVEYALRSSPMGRREKREAALEALAQVGLAACANRRPDQLSGGQRQRVAIARAFVHAPQLVIADEPTASLDQASALEVLDVLARLRENHGSTVIMASHDAMAVASAERKIAMRDGVISDR